MGLPLGQKRIGLQQREGMAIVVLNPGGRRMKRGRLGSAAFARQAARQGRRVPPPDVVLASSPPLALAGVASSLSSFYKVPLLLEIGGDKDSLPGSGGSLLERVLQFPVRRRARQAYCRAESVIFTSQETAEAAAEIFIPFGRVRVLPDEGDYESLFHEFKGILAACEK